MRIHFFVPGIARPGGSKKGFINPKTKGVILTDAGGKPLKMWRQDVAHAAVQAMNGRPPFAGPLLLSAAFVMQRPKKHYHTSKARLGQLRDDAPIYHTIRPDRTKLLRAVEDAMTGIVWKDDAQVCGGGVSKQYGDRPGAEIMVQTISDGKA